MAVRPLEKIAFWFDTRLGLSYPLQRYTPAYSVDPFYWPGSLTVVAFVIEGITGMLMMFYYVPPSFSRMFGVSRRG